MAKLIVTEGWVIEDVLSSHNFLEKQNMPADWRHSLGMLGEMDSDAALSGWYQFLKSVGWY